MANTDITSVESKVSALLVEDKEDNEKVEKHSNHCNEAKSEFCDKQKGPTDSESCSDDEGVHFKDAADPIKQAEAAAAISTDDEYHSADEGDPHVDEEQRKEIEAQLSDEEKKV